MIPECFSPVRYWGFDSDLDLEEGHQISAEKILFKRKARLYCPIGEKHHLAMIGPSDVFVLCASLEVLHGLGWWQIRRHLQS
jgi:hypothetical protein